MKDRQPTRPGRVKITPENGAAYYAVMEMADEPTEVGTPPTKANLLKDSTAALLGGNADMVPDEAFVALKNLISGITPELIGAAKIETGSYTGTGKNGEGNKNTLTFGFEPKLVIVSAKVNSGPSYDQAIFVKGHASVLSSIANASTVFRAVEASFSGNVLTWYSTYNVWSQLNGSNTTYVYVAIG